MDTEEAAIDTNLETAAETEAEAPANGEVSADELLVQRQEEPADTEARRLKAILEAIVYITDEPLTLRQIAEALGEPADRIRPLLDELVADFDRPEHGLSIREVAEGYVMSTKAEHHEVLHAFVRKLTPPLRLSIAALETLAVVAYKQPITAPEIMEIRGVQGAGVIKTLLERKLIATAGRKQVLGRPMLYKTTKDFLVQFGLKDLGELPTLKEFEELARVALSDSEVEEPVEQETESESANDPETLSEL